jgi:hypothetical protein
VPSSRLFCFKSREACEFVDGRSLKNNIFEPIIMINSQLKYITSFLTKLLSCMLRLALKLQKSSIVAKVQIKVVLLRLNIKPIKIDEEKI